MKSFMKKCMGSIMNVPGCEGINNTTPENRPKRDQTNQSKDSPPPGPRPPNAKGRA